jgi:hypothetical protein
MSDKTEGAQAPNQQVIAPEAAPAARAARRPARSGVAATLAIVSAGLAALFAAGSVWLHAVGLAYHGAYLGHYGVPAGVFPADGSDLMYLGFLALLERGIWVTTSWIAQPASWLAVAVAYAYVRLMKWMLPEALKPTPNLPKWAAWTIREILVPFLFLAGFVFVLLLLIFFFWGAISPGHYAGLRQAEKEMSAAQVACRRCLTVETDTRSLTGRLLAATTTDIAIYVPEERRSHVIPRAEITALTSNIASASEDRAGAEKKAGADR